MMQILRGISLLRREVAGRQEKGTAHPDKSWYFVALQPFRCNDCSCVAQTVYYTRGNMGTNIILPYGGILVFSPEFPAPLLTAAGMNALDIRHPDARATNLVSMAPFIFN